MILFLLGAATATVGIFGAAYLSNIWARDFMGMPRKGIRL